MTMEEKRVHIGGLFPGVQKDDLVERFSRFGKVKDIDIKIRKDNNGSPIKTFAYVSLQTNEADLQKCFATYSKTKWKGSELRLQLAKDNFIDRLEKERKTQAELREIEAKAPPKPVEKPPVVRNKLDDIPGIENFQMKGAPPGTAIPGAENWTVGKYGRVLPVVELKKKGIRKTIKVDPSKLTHNLKRINDESYTNGSKVSNLTWQIDAHESEITKKRKGEFPDDKTKKIKKVINDESFKQKIFEVLENSKKMEEERKKADNALDVVPVVVNERFNTGLAKKLLSIAAIDGMAKFDSDSEDDVKDADGLTKKDRIAAVKQLGKSTRQLKREKMKEERRMKMEKLKAERANRKKNNADNTTGSRRQNLNENKQNSENLPNKKQKVQEIGNGNSSVGKDNPKAGSNASVLNRTQTAEKIVKSQTKVPDKTVVLVDGKRTLKAFRGTKHLNETSNMHSDGSNNKTSEPVTRGKKKIIVEKSNTIAMDGDLNLDQDIDDGQSVSSTDTAELISRKKPQSTKTQGNDKVMVAQKTSRTQNWLANQSMGVDEFSAGFHQAATGNHRDSRSFRNFADGYFQDDDEDIDDFEQFAKTELAKHSRMMRRTSTKATISNKLLDTAIDKREKGDQKNILSNNTLTSNNSKGKINEKGDSFVNKAVTTNASILNKGKAIVNEKGAAAQPQVYQSDSEADSQAEESTSEDEDEDETTKTNNDKDVKGIVKETEDSDSEGNDSSSDDTDEEASDDEENGDAIANGKGKEEDSESNDGDSSDDNDNETKTNDDKGVKDIVKGKEDDLDSNDDDDESSSDDEDDESTAINNDDKGGGKGIVKGEEDDSHSNDSSSDDEDDETTNKTNDDKGGKGTVKDREDDAEADSDDEDDDNSSSGDSGDLETSDDDDSSEDTKIPENDKFTNLKRLTKTDDSDNDGESSSDEEETSDDENSANTESEQNNVKTLTNGHGQDKISNVKKLTKADESENDSDGENSETSDEGESSEDTKSENDKPTNVQKLTKIDEIDNFSNVKKLTKADDSDSDSEGSSYEESDSDDSSSGEEMEVDDENDMKVNTLGKKVTTDILNDANKLTDKISPSTTLSTKSSESKVVKDGSDSEDSSSSDENSDNESDDENADTDDDDDENSGDELDDESESDDSSDFGDLIAQEMKKIQPDVQADPDKPIVAEKVQPQIKAAVVKSVGDMKRKEKSVMIGSEGSSETDDSSSECEDTESDSDNNCKEVEDKVAADAIQVKSKEVSSDSSESDSSDSDSDGEMDEGTSKVKSKMDVSSQGDKTSEKKLPNSKPSVEVSSDSSESDSSDSESDVDNDKVTSKVENKASNSQIEETSKKPIEAPKAGAASSSSESDSSDNESSDDSNSDKKGENSKVENRTSKSGIQEETSSKKVVESKPSSDTSSESDSSDNESSDEDSSSDENIENTLQVENRTSKSGIAETLTKEVEASKASDTSSESESSDSDDESSDSGDGSNSDKNMTSIKPVETPNKTAASKGSKSDVIAKTGDSSIGLAKSNKDAQDAPTKIADSKAANSGATIKTVDSNRGSSTKSSRDIAKQAEDADRKRLDTLKQQKLANQEQKTAIQNALSNIDKGRTASVNKKIVFDSDSEDDDVDVVPMENNTTTSPLKAKPDRSSKLFDSSSSDDDSGDDSDSDDNVDEEDSARFNIKQQFEGSAGSKLATLQSRYGNDERFRLDSRFAEDASGDEEDAAGGDEDLADEKLRSMRILQSVVGIKGVKAISKQDRAKIKFKDIGSMKYDPSKAEHKSFEVSQEPKTKKKKKNAEKSAEVDTQETESQPEEESTPIVLPEVSKEKFYEISDSLKETFVSKAKGDAGSSGATSSGGGFSLLAAFGRKPDSEAEEDEDDVVGGDFKAAEPIPSSLRGDNLSLSNRFRLAGDDGGSEESSSSDDEHDYQSIRKKADKRADQKHSGTGSTGTGKETKTDTKQVMSSTPRTFFFTEDDERLANGAQFYRRDDPDTLKQKWRENRFHLTEKYQTKYKNYKRKLADGGKPAYKERNPKSARRGR